MGVILTNAAEYMGVRLAPHGRASYGRYQVNDSLHNPHPGSDGDRHSDLSDPELATEPARTLGYATVIEGYYSGMPVERALEQIAVKVFQEIMAKAPYSRLPDVVRERVKGSYVKYTAVWEERTYLKELPFAGHSQCAANDSPMPGVWREPSAHDPGVCRNPDDPRRLPWRSGLAPGGE